jgi:predicted nucleotidyltransferase
MSETERAVRTIANPPDNNPNPDTHLTDQLRSALKGFPGLELVLLFGSLGRGQARPDSDVDIAVQADHPLSAQERMALIDTVSQTLQRPVDLVDLRTAGEPTKGQVVRHGRRVLGSSAAHGRLIYTQLVDQADFGPLRRRILEERRIAWTGK